MTIIKQFISICASLFSVLKINIRIFLYKLLTKNKVIFFYHPKKNLTKNNIKYIDKYFSSYTDILTIYGSFFFFNTKNYYLIKPFFLNFIYGVDFFFTNNVSDQFTKNSKKIYVHHDIFDTPLVESRKELILCNRLLKYDFIVVASELSKKIFSQLFRNIHSHPKIFIFRYLKLDYLKKKIELYKVSKCKTVLVAPTNFRSFPQLSIQKILPSIIKILLDCNFKVIYRPHPSNTEEIIVKDIKYVYSKYNNFYFDQSIDYSETFKSSDILITDLSGTAYTFVISCSKPVVFYSTNSSVKNFIYKNLNYFRFRSKIGYIVNNNKEMIKVLNLKNLYRQKNKSIQDLRNYFLSQKKMNIKYFY
jgi:hypothetical protein